ncbi:MULTISPECIES: recombinase family protein [unclassified Agarivorans]|uniref:recombinase family protein n=1 Tax=unclassified Agarivorans TaxID=2636026 RepID=UPI003D7CA675
MERSYIYARMSPKFIQQAAQNQTIQSQYPEAELKLETGIRGNVPALERPVLSTLMAQLKTGDTLIVWWINCLGSSFTDIHSTISQLLTQGVTIKTYDQQLSIHADSKQLSLINALLTGFANNQRCRRLAAAALSREALRQNPSEWNKKYQGRKCDQEKHQKIAAALIEGKTLQQAADESGASLSTVKRVKAKIAEQGNLGDMRLKRKSNKQNQSE